MNSKIERLSSNSILTIANGAALSDVLDMRAYAGGIVIMPASWTSASLAFYHSADANGTFYPLYDENNTLLEMTVQASRAYVIPDKVFACHYIKLWSETTASDVNQGADRALTVTLKG